MKLSVKTLACITISLLLAITLPAQLKIPVVSGIGPDIKKVILDYPNQFSNLQGELIMCGCANLQMALLRAKRSSANERPLSVGAFMFCMNSYAGLANS